MPNYQKGQRVLYTSPGEMPGYAFHAASMGGDLVMHLNARDENGDIKPISGRLLTDGQADQGGHVYYDFAPDGWICGNKSGWPGGFQVYERDLRPLAEDAPEQKGTITDRLGRPV